jgi:hypothetical protein
LILSLAAFNNIDQSASADSATVWAEEEEHVRMERINNVSAMDIYDIKMEGCESDHSSSRSLENWLQFLLGQTYFLN